MSYTELLNKLFEKHLIVCIAMNLLFVNDGYYSVREFFWKGKLCAGHVIVFDIIYWLAVCW